jgi:hypothetical protein
MSAGIVYVLTNEAMPGLVKIGFTRSDLIQRIKALDRTGVPYAFECFCAFEVSDCARAEQLLPVANQKEFRRQKRAFNDILLEQLGRSRLHFHYDSFL